MAKALLFHLDGSLPNLALMRIAAHHRLLGHEVELRRGKPEPRLIDGIDQPDFVYGSAIFLRTLPVAQRLLMSFPQAVIGGTGFDLTRTLEDIGVTTVATDYSIYPGFTQSIGFTQRGCRLRCGFCVVPRKEGAVSGDQTVTEIWRQEPWPRELILLDNDFFGQSSWRERIAEIRDGHFKVNFNQGINARFLTDETAEAVASVDFRNVTMQDRRIYTAWDNRKDEQRLFDGLARLVKYGVRPHHIMVYLLIGYWPGETHEDREYRSAKLRDFGALPYPMPYERTPELVGFQRWVIGGYDRRVPWKDFAGAIYQPRSIRPVNLLPLLEGIA